MLLFCVHQSNVIFCLGTQLLARIRARIRTSARIGGTSSSVTDEDVPRKSIMSEALVQSSIKGEDGIVEVERFSNQHFCDGLCLLIK